MFPICLVEKAINAASEGESVAIRVHLEQKCKNFARFRENEFLLHDVTAPRIWTKVESERHRSVDAA
jgi:hypothetical protein